MSLILNIDTAQEIARLSLAENGEVLVGLDNGQQKDHASFVQPGIRQMFEKLGRPMSDLNAVAVSIGPGSYTGLRVGMASAKGICYAMQIPLIGVSTLELMALGAQMTVHDVDAWCPMIDARRQEVFTAIYDKELHPILPPQALVLEPGSLKEFIKKYRILFFGSGFIKWKKIILHDHNHKRCIFENILIENKPLAILSNRYFLQELFVNLAYAEPLYLKEFHHTSGDLKS